MMNVATGHISPQYHVVFNDLFETMDTTFQDPALALDHTGHERYLSDADAPPPLDVQWDNTVDEDLRL